MTNVSNKIQLVMDNAFRQEAFAASAAALVASHAMSDTVWDLYFPELPKHQPELRTILIDLHRLALAGEPSNITAAVRWIEQRFDVTDNTARLWIELLENLGFLVILPAEKKNERHVVPAHTAKVGLFKVGLEYLTCLRLAHSALRGAIKRNSLDTSELDWLESVDKTLKLEAIDYPTSPKSSVEVGGN